MENEMAVKKAKVDATKKVPKAKPVTGFAPLKFQEFTLGGQC